MDRREFLKTGAVASAVAGLAAGSAARAQDQDEKLELKPVLPTRVLGKTGEKVTILNQGTVAVPGFIQALFRRTYINGVRYYDTAKVYGGGKTEPVRVHQVVRRRMPEVRKTIFLATKQPTGDPKRPHQAPSTSGSRTSAPITSTCSTTTASARASSPT